MQYRVPKSQAEAIEIQSELSAKVNFTHNLPMSSIGNVCGLDIAYDKHSDQLVAGAVVVDLNSLEVVESQCSKASVEFPYIPGLFSFRELPPLVQVITQLKSPVDVFVCDGQGLAHPRFFGLACHIGLVTGVPTIGSAKSLLCGQYDDLGTGRGQYSDILYKSRVVGCALRTQDNVKLVFVSVGHLCTLENAKDIVVRLTPKYRIPEAIRQADQLVKRVLKDG